MKNFWAGFEKQAAIDWFYRNRNRTVSDLGKDLGEGYKPEHLQSYAKNLRPWESGKSRSEVASHVKRLYDKKTHYEKLQSGLIATKPGSKEEADYLKKNKGALDSGLRDWLHDYAGTMADFRRKPSASRKG